MHNTYAENTSTAHDKLYQIPSDVLGKLQVVGAGFLLFSLSATLLFAATRQYDHSSGNLEISGNLGADRECPLTKRRGKYRQHLVMEDCLLLTLLLWSSQCFVALYIQDNTVISAAHPTCRLVVHNE